MGPIGVVGALLSTMLTLLVLVLELSPKTCVGSLLVSLLAS